MDNFDTITTRFISKLKAALKKIVSVLLSIDVNNKEKVIAYLDEATSSLTGIFADLFADGKAITPTYVKSTLSKLIDSYDIPLKYNKDLLTKIDNISVFTGYYDKAYADVYTKREILNLKKVLLQGKYARKTEAEITQDVLNTINVTKQSAQLLARTEIQRLRETTNLLYFTEIKKINKEYNRVWVTKHDGVVRPSHERMDGKLADPETGQFFSEDVGWINGPGSGPTPFSINCRCYTKLVKKENK